MTMSLLDSLFAPGTIERLGWMLVHVLWQATAVAILLAVFLRLLRSASANVRYGAACSALALMVVLPLVTMHYLQTPGPVAEAGPASVAVVLPAVTEGATPKHSTSVTDSGYMPNPEDTLKASLSVPPMIQPTEPTIPVPLRERLVSALEPALPYVVLGWLIGVFGLSAWHLGGWTQLQRLKRRMVREIGTPLQRKLEELGARLGLHRAVGLLESALVEVPTVVGWLRPVILLPASALTGLRPEQLEAILAHELAHIRRYDYLVNMLQTVVEILGFYHPAIWWVSHRIRIERENCCDDLAVYVCGSSLQYAKALACMEEIRHGGTDLAVAATGGSLVARIARLLGRPAVEDRRFAWLPGLVALLLVVAIVIPAAFTLGAGNPPQSSTDTGENYQALRREHVALLSRPEVQLHEARAAIRLFQEHQDWEGLALAYEAAAQAMWRVTHTPPEVFTRPIPPPQPPIGRYPVAEVQTNLDGVWSPSRNDAASWIYWLRGKQQELVLERIETLMKLGGLCSERLGSPARAVEAYQAAGREAPLFEEPLGKLIPRMWPEQTINTGLVLALTVPGAEEILLRILRALADAQVATGDLRGAAETRLRAMLASLISCGGDWHAQGPAREAEAFWQIVRRLPPDQPLPPTLWLHILDHDKPALDFPAPEAAPHGLPYSFPGARLVIRPGRTAQTLTVSADMETPGGGGGVRCFTIIGDNVRHLGTVAWHQDNRPGREWRTATFNVPEDTGIIRLETTPYNRSIFHVHELKVQATFVSAQAATASPSPTGTSGQAEGEGTDTTRADAEAKNTPDETRQVLLEFKIAKVWSDLRPDHETLLLLANALGVESPLARELGRPGRQFNMTLGEVLRRYVVPQSLSQPAAQALIDLLQSRGYLKMEAEPQVVAQDNKQAQVRTTTDEHFWMPPGSSNLERIAYGTAVDVTPHITDDNRVALDMMVELTEPVPGVEDSNQPKLSRTSAETSMIAPKDRYLVWAAMEQAADQSEAAKGRQSLYVMVKPVILRPAPGYAGPTGTPKPAKAPLRQVLLDVRTVTMERDGLLNLGVEWSWPTTKAGEFSGPSGNTPSPGADGKRPWGVQIGYTPDRQFTDSLLAALDVLQESGQAHVSGQQILAQDGRLSRIKALTEEWYTVTARATKQSPQSQTETHKTESGTVVTITPRLGDNGAITLETAVEVSTSLPKARGSDLPLLTRRTAKNAVTIRDGGTVAVAGLVENRAGPNDKSVRETAIFVTAHLIQDVNEAALPAPQSTATPTRVPPASLVPPEQQMLLRQEYVNSDPMVRELAKNIVEAERELIVLRQKFASTHPTVVQKNAFLEALRQRLNQKRTELEQAFDRGSAERWRTTTDRSSREITVTATLTNTDLLSVLAEMSQRTGVKITPDLTVKTAPITVELAEVPLETALLQVLKHTPYASRKSNDGTYLVFRPLSFTFPQVELIQALQDLSAAAHVPIVADLNVTGTVNARFENVSLDEALEMLLAGKPYMFKRMPRYYLVADRGLISRPPEILETRPYRSTYVSAPRAKALLSPVFAPYVQVEPPRTQDPNAESYTLIVTAPPALADQIVADIQEIDRHRRQVLLDARVVVIEPNDLRSLGLEWSRLPVPITTRSPSTAPNTIVPRTGCAPDRTATDSLMMALNLLQENHRADIIANPKVVAQDGRQAQMKMIQEQWFMMTTPDPNWFINRAELSKIESGTVLTITPRIGDNNDITLEMTVEVTDSIPKARGNVPLITRRTVKNALTVKDGGTVAVTGLIENRGKSSEKRVPGLADLPLIGELFKNRNNGKAGRELVVFVTAHLVPDTGRVPLPTAMSAEGQVGKPGRGAGAEQTAAVDESASRAWYILRQWNCPPLLLGLTQQLAKALEPSQRNGSAWQELTNGGTLRLKLEVEGNLPGEVIVGLFQDARWSAPPVAVRRLGVGTHMLTGLPAGQYQIGAMLGNAPLPVALGVHRTWPTPIEIKAGQTATAEVLVSEAFQEHASGWYNEEVAKDYIGAWSNLDESNLLQGRLTGPGGRPIPFGEIMIREHRTDNRGFAAPNRGTNEQGLYRFDEMAWPYRVIARWREPLPSAFGCRYQTMSLNRVLKGSQQIDLAFEPFPQGTAKLTGRVLDQKDRPVEGFFLRVLAVSSDQLGRGWEELDGKTHTYTGYDTTFVSQDGSFDLGSLPEGPACVQVIPFEGRRYERGGLKDVSLAAGQATSLDFRLTGKDVFYGRVLFEDGTPAVIRPAPWPGAGTRILLARSRTSRAPAVSEVDAQGYFAIYLDEGGRDELASGRLQLSISLPDTQEHRFHAVGEFPTDELSQDRSHAGVVRVKRPAPTTPAPNGF